MKALKLAIDSWKKAVILHCYHENGGAINPADIERLLDSIPDIYYRLAD
jgi:hypothetical protein